MKASTILSATVVAAVVSGFAPVAVAAEKSSYNIAGSNRYETSLLVAQKFFPNSTDVIVATGNNYADALSAGPWAAKLTAPIVLLGDNLNNQQAGYLSGKNIHIVGGHGAISVSLEGSLPGKVVERVAGADRFDTSAQIAQRVGNFNSVFLASGMNYPDALTGGVLAAKSLSPILLVGDRLTPAATNILQNSHSVFLLGGLGAISANIEQEIKTKIPQGNVVRYAGVDRYDTAAKINAVVNGKVRFNVKGNNWPDSLSMVSVAAQNGGFLSLTRPDEVVPDASPTNWSIGNPGIPPLKIPTPNEQKDKEQPRPTPRQGSHYAPGSSIISFQNGEIWYDASKCAQEPMETIQDVVPFAVVYTRCEIHFENPNAPVKTKWWVVGQASPMNVYNRTRNDYGMLVNWDGKVITGKEAGKPFEFNSVYGLAVHPNEDPTILTTMQELVAKINADPYDFFMNKANDEVYFRH